VPLPRSKSKIEFSQCFQCKEVLERTKVLNAQTQESVLKIREEALMLEHLLQGEALRRKGDELRLQQKSLDKATKDHKKAQEEQVKNIATSFQGKRTNRFSLCYTNNKY
jgi:hypothetical protein